MGERAPGRLILLDRQSGDRDRRQTPVTNVTATLHREPGSIPGRRADHTWSDIVLCCKQDRDTPFCPQCGRALMSQPLVHLVIYLRKLAQKHGTQAYKCQQRENRWGRYSEAQRERYFQSFKDAEHKYTSWADAVERVITVEPRA